jgi:UDP-N-acetylmuramate dehydrogenase
MSLKILENILLEKYTTFKIGGPARYFIKAKTNDEVKKAIKWAKENNIPFFILGGGSNVLFSDNGFKGLVVKLETSFYKIKDSKIFAEAGVKLEKLVKIAKENNLTGLEWAVKIPGTVGGAIRGNAGAFGHSISEIVNKVYVLNGRKEEEFTKEDCFLNIKRVFLKIITH